MTIEDHVPLRETCERLGAVGFPLTSLFVWVCAWNYQADYDDEEGPPVAWLVVPYDEVKNYSTSSQAQLYAAPLATETLREIVKDQAHPQAKIEFDGVAWHVSLEDSNAAGNDVISVWRVNTRECSHETNPAEAAALLWLSIYAPDEVRHEG
jgi:hypothetical protein